MFYEMSNERMELAEIKGLFLELNDLSAKAFTDCDMSESKAREYVQDIRTITSRIYDKIVNMKRSK